MQTTKTTFVLVLMFGLAWGAGAVTAKLKSAAGPPSRTEGSLLSEELQLDGPQREQMRAVWEAVRDRARSCATEAQAAQHERDEQVVAMLSEDQKARYAQLNEQTRRKIDNLDKERKEAFRKAVAGTETILRADQRQAYQRIIQNRIGGLPGGGLELGQWK